jgi:hypothetical protein
MNDAAAARALLAMLLFTGGCTALGCIKIGKMPHCGVSIPDMGGISGRRGAVFIDIQLHFVAFAANEPVKLTNYPHGGGNG